MSAMVGLHYSAAPLTRKLGRYASLTTDEIQAIDNLVLSRVGTRPGKDMLAREGDNHDRVHVILSGWAYRFKILGDGRRQILSFLLPGDICDYSAFLMDRLDYSIGTLTSVSYAELERDTFQHFEMRYPSFARAVLKDTMIGAAAQREWSLNLGQRDAFERTAHLICELYVRLELAGLVQASSFLLPMTQADIADAMGMSPVHVNRTVQALRAEGLIILEGRNLSVPNFDALKRVALFNPRYLHLSDNRSAAA